MKHMKHTLLLSLLLLCTMLTTSCEGAYPTSPVATYRYLTVDARAWDSRDTLTFDLPAPSDTLTAYRCTLYLRTTSAYPYTDLHLSTILDTLTTVGSTSVPQRRSTLTIPLCHSDGQRITNGFPYADQALPLQTLTLHPDRHYRLHITHRMRRNPIAGVAAIGIKVEPLAAPFQ